MSLIVDGLALLAGMLISAGVYLEFGLGFSLIACGFYLFAVTLVSVNTQMGQINDSDT